MDKMFLLKLFLGIYSLALHMYWWWEVDVAIMIMWRYRDYGCTWGDPVCNLYLREYISKLLKR